MSGRPLPVVPHALLIFAGGRCSGVGDALDAMLYHAQGKLVCPARVPTDPSAAALSEASASHPHGGYPSLLTATSGVIDVIQQKVNNSACVCVCVCVSVCVSVYRYVWLLS